MFNGRELVRISLLIVLLILIVWWILMQFSPDRQSPVNYAFNAGYASLYLIGGLYALKHAFTFRFSSNLGKSYALFSGALISYAAALIIWSAYNVIFKVTIPYPSIADFFFVLFYPLIIMAVFYLKQFYNVFPTRRLMIETGIFFVFIASLFTVVNFNVVDHRGDSLWVIGLDLFYPLADAVLITLSLMGLRIMYGQMKRGFMILMLAFLVQGVADILFIYWSSAGLYWNGDFSDLLLAMCGLLFSFGILDMVGTLPEEE